MALTQPTQPPSRPPLLRDDYHLAESWDVPRVLEWLHSLNPVLNAHCATWAAARIDGGALLRLDAARLEGELGVRSAVHRGVVLHHLQRLRDVVDEGKLVQRQWEMQQQQQQSQQQQQQALPQDDAPAAQSAEAEIRAEAEAQQQQPLKPQPNALDSAGSATAVSPAAVSGSDSAQPVAESDFPQAIAAASAPVDARTDPPVAAELAAEEEAHAEEEEEEERPVHLVVSPSTLSYPYSSAEPLRLTLRIRNPLPRGRTACWNLASSHPGVHRFVRHVDGGGGDGHVSDAEADAEFGFGFLDPGQEALVDVLVDPVWLRSSAASATATSTVAEAPATTGMSDCSFSEFLFSNLVDLDCFLLLQAVQAQPQQQATAPGSAAAAPATGGDEAAELWCVQRHAGSAAMLPPPWNDAPSAACAPVRSAALPGLGLGLDADRAGEPPSNFERLRATWHAQRWPWDYHGPSGRMHSDPSLGPGAEDAADRRMRGQRSAQRAHAHIVDTFLCSLASSHRILLQAKAAPAGAGQRGPGEARAYWNASAAASSVEEPSFFTYIPCLWSNGGLLEKKPPGPPSPGRGSLLPATAEQLRHGGGACAGGIGGGGGVSAYWSAESCRTVASGPTGGGYSHPSAGGAVEAAMPFAHQVWPRGGQVATALVQQQPGFYTEWAGRKTRFEEPDMGGVLVAEPQQELQPQTQPQPEPDSPVLRPRAAAPAPTPPAATTAAPSACPAPPPSWRFFRLVVRLQVRFRRGRLAAATRLKRRLILSQLEQERALAAKVASAAAGAAAGAGGAAGGKRSSASSSSSSRRMTGAEFLQSQEARMQLALAKQEQQQLQEEHSARDSQAEPDTVAPLVPAAAEEGQRHLALQRFGADDGVDMATLWREAATASEAPPVSLATFRLVVGLQVRFRRLRRIAGAKLREKVLRSQLEEQLAMTARLRARREAPGGDGLSVVRGSKRLSGAEWIAQQLASSAAAAAAAAAEAPSRVPAAAHSESEPSCTMEGGYMTETLDTIAPADAGALAPAAAAAADADADAATEAGAAGSDASSATEALGSAATLKLPKRVLWADGDGEEKEEQDGKQDDTTPMTMTYETHEAVDSGFLVERLHSEVTSSATSARPSAPLSEPAPEHEHAAAPAPTPAPLDALEPVPARDAAAQEMLRTEADMRSRLAEDEGARAARRARRLTGAEWARQQQQQDQQQNSVDDAAVAAPAKADTLRPASASDIIPSAAASPEDAGALARRGTESKESLRAQILEAQRTILALQAAQIQQIQRQQQQQQQAQAQIAQSVQESSPSTAQSPAPAEPEPRPQTPPRPVAGADAAEAAGGAASEQHAQEDEFVYHAVDAEGNEFVLQPVPLAVHQQQQQQQQQQQHQQQQEHAFSPARPSPYFFPSSPPPQPFRPSPPPRHQPSTSGSFDPAQASSPAFATPSPPAKQPRLVNIQRVDRSKLGVSPRTARVQSQSFSATPDQQGPQGPFSPPYGHAHAASYDYSAAAAAAASAASAQLHQLPVHHPHYAQLAASMHAPPAFPQPPHFYGFYPPPYPYPYPPPPPPPMPSHAHAHAHAHAQPYGSHAAYPFPPPFSYYPYAPVPPTGPPTASVSAVDAVPTNPAPTLQPAHDPAQHQRNESIQTPVQTPQKPAVQPTPQPPSPQQQQQQQSSHAAEEATEEYDEFEVERARGYEHEHEREPERTGSEHADASPPPPQQQRPQHPVSARPSPPQPAPPPSSSRPLPTQPPQQQQQPQQPSGPVSPQRPTHAQTQQQQQQQQQQQPALSPSQVQMQVQSSAALPRPSVPGPRPPTAPRPVFRAVLSPPAAAPANNGQVSPASRDQGRDRDAEMRSGAATSPGEEFLRQKRMRQEFMRWTQTQAAAASAAADAQIASTSYSPAPQASGPVRLVASPRNPRPARDDPGQATAAALARAEEAAKALDVMSQEEEEEEYEQDFDFDGADGAEGAHRRGAVASPSALEAQYIRAATAQIRADKGASVAEEKEHAAPATQPSGSGLASARSRSAMVVSAPGASPRRPAVAAAESYGQFDADSLRSALYQPLVEERRRAEADESGLPAYPPYRSSYYKQSAGGGFLAAASPAAGRVVDSIAEAAPAPRPGPLPTATTRRLKRHEAE